MPTESTKYQSLFTLNLHTQKTNHKHYQGHTSWQRETSNCHHSSKELLFGKLRKESPGGVLVFKDDISRFFCSEFTVEWAEVSGVKVPLLGHIHTDHTSLSVDIEY